MSVKISQLEIENVKRVKAVSLAPSASGLTIIGGNNNQGKTSVLDAIAWALGGEKFRPSSPHREGSVLPPRIKLELDNGLIVERGGKNSALKVTDPSGNKSGQQLLNEFVEVLALDLPRFMEQNDKAKASTLLKIIGVEDQLIKLNKEETELYNQRLLIGRDADRKIKYAEELPSYPDAPGELISAADLIRRQQDILAKNAENQRKRDRLKETIYEKQRISDEILRLEQQIGELTDKLQERKAAYEQAERYEDIARKDAIELQDESTAELEKDIENIDIINAKVRTNLDKAKAEEEAEYYRQQYAAMTDKIELVRSNRMHLLDSAKMPLEGLSVEDGELVYMGHKWDSMSGSDQLRVSTAIVKALNPKCGFVLLDKLEQMDLKTLKEFSEWLEAQGLQAIATRVSGGNECSIIIEDGYAADAIPDTGGAETTRTATETAQIVEKTAQATPKWKRGVF